MIPIKARDRASIWSGAGSEVVDGTGTPSTSDGAADLLTVDGGGIIRSGEGSSMASMTGALAASPSGCLAMELQPAPLPVRKLRSVH